MVINSIPFVTDLSDIINELRVQLQLNGITLLQNIKETPDDIMVSCPYHKGGQERRPSMGIRKSDGLCHCFTCGETHSLQEMISFCFGRNSDLAGSFGWEWLLKNFLTVGVESRKDISLDLSRNRSNNRVEYVTEKELDSYRYYHEYMWKRKMTAEVVEIFDVGYDCKTKCLTFPVRDVTGGTLFVARRSVVQKFFNYPSGTEKPVYGLYELSKAFTTYTDTVAGTATVSNYAWMPKVLDEVIICESMINAITCWVYGKYAVALNGTGTPHQYEQLKTIPCRKFICALDPDEAGERGYQRLKKGIGNKLLTKYVIPKGKDINDLSLEEFNALEEVF